MASTSSSSSSSSYWDNEKTREYNDILAVFVNRSKTLSQLTSEKGAAYTTKLLDIYRFNAWSFPDRRSSSSNSSSSSLSSASSASSASS